MGASRQRGRSRVENPIGERPSLMEYFLDIAVAVSERSICPSGKKHGAVLVDARNRIVSTGYNGPKAGKDPCAMCTLETDKLGKDWRTCPAIHAEVNAMLNLEGTMPQRPLRIYVTKKPCEKCQDLLDNRGIGVVHL